MTQQHDDYDAAADMSASIEECYRAIRERVARGGPGFDPERKPPGSPFDDLAKLRLDQSKYEEIERGRWHATRFHRAAHRHDSRIPFETRLAVLERANEHCEHCDRFIASDFAACLELHHLTYDRAYGNELPEDLMALCRDCHAAKHGM